MDRVSLLTVLRTRSVKTYKGAARVVADCLCACGKEKTILEYNVRKKVVFSCGCLRDEKARQTSHVQYTHGETKTKLYKKWGQMKNRCKYTPNAHKNKYYFDRGITVCEEWLKYEAFRDWSLLNGYQEALSLDRIDNDLGYSPSNCRWVTWDIQCKNKRNSKNKLA